GGSVALMAAALDSRVAGAAVVAAFSPWRSSNKQYESLRTYSHLHGFIPRLGFFAADSRQTPLDFGEIIAAIAPKPLLIIAPDLDRYADITAIQNIMKPVAGVYRLYGSADHLSIRYPHEINRMTEDMFTEIADFYSQMLSKR